MSSETVIRAVGLGKAYAIYKRPRDRLKQIFARNGTRYFEEYWALRDVDLSIGRGESIALIGQNGAGKSTLLKLLYGTVQPTTGDLEVNGRVGALLELGSGFNPEFTGRENLRLSAAVMGFSDAEILARQDAIIAFADIGDFIDQPVKLYSSGMYARLAFAVMAHLDPDILIVDEILSVGDALFQQKCMRFIRKFRERGTLLFVSHDTGAVLNLCETAIWFEAGRVRMSGPAKDVCRAYQAFTESTTPKGSALEISARSGQNAGSGNTDQSGPAEQSISIDAFDPEAPWFGQRGASIIDVSLFDADGQPLSQLAGGDRVTLRVLAQAHEELAGPIIGFFVKDRLGQNLFGDNTFASPQNGARAVESGSYVTAEFTFKMPFMPSGDYAITVALAEGSQLDHVQHHWIDDALVFHVTSATDIQGLVGIPMESVAMSIAPNRED